MCLHLWLHGAAEEGQMSPSAPWPGLAACTGEQCPRCQTIPLSRCSRLPYLPAGEQPRVGASSLLGDCSPCRGLDPAARPAEQLGSNQNQAGSSSKSQLSPTAPRLILHLARCSLTLLLSHFLMHFCLATKHELCYQKLIS